MSAVGAKQVAGAARDAWIRIVRGALDFGVRVYHKAGQDDIFFLAGGIAFNVLVAAVPFLLLLVAIFGLVLRFTLDDPAQAAVEYVVSILPASDAIVEYTRSVIAEIVEGSTRFGLLGLVLFVWFSTRLIGSLRAALQDVFDIPEGRGILAGKLFDAQMVIIAGSLFLANTGITVAIEAIHTYGVGALGWESRVFQAFYAQLLAFAFIYFMFVLIYRYLPARRVSWRISLVAAAFSATVWEVLKAAFAWWVSHAAQLQTAYGALATLIFLVFWIYYSAVVFILGGVVGQVYDLIRITRKQRELLD